VEREAPLGAGQLDTFFPYGIPSAALGGAKEYLALFNYSEIRNPKSEILNKHESPNIK
jgi:hypothetical protein